MSKNKKPQKRHKEQPKSSFNQHNELLYPDNEESNPITSFINMILFETSAVNARSAATNLFPIGTDATIKSLKIFQQEIINCISTNNVLSFELCLLCCGHNKDFIKNRQSGYMLDYDSLKNLNTETEEAFIDMASDGEDLIRRYKILAFAEAINGIDRIICALNGNNPSVIVYETLLFARNLVQFSNEIKFYRSFKTLAGAKDGGGKHTPRKELIAIFIDSLSKNKEITFKEEWKRISHYNESNKLCHGKYSFYIDEATESLIYSWTIHNKSGGREKEEKESSILKATAQIYFSEAKKTL
ncbi:hypothetical protein K9F62_19760 [Desulfovibrio sp. JY]|nr:hypothetical protein K9F62_19760 [Desulfovibrio sp. JY]